MQAPSDLKVRITKLGEETVDGHAGVKNQAIITDSRGSAHELTVWNAGDLKGFPVRIETTEPGMRTAFVFKTVTFAKPASSQFDLPSGYKKYDSYLSMLQQAPQRSSGSGTNLDPRPHGQ